MTPKMPTTSAPGLGSGHRRSNLPLYLLRHGSGLVAFGILSGYLLPLVPYPRLGLTAHVQFTVQGCMVLLTGLVLLSDPVGTLSGGQTVRLADRMNWWQRRIIYWGCSTVWITLLAEGVNAWWGTSWVMPIAHQAAGLTGYDLAPRWMEIFMVVTHWPFTIPLALVVSCLS